ncbi:MAG: virulence protein SciE type [Proteobacteria bacterium]|nr:MAG: virulence protein SciE type [Pseudomonadota bacterium]
MTVAQELFGAGDLTGCLAELQNDVRRAPADGKLRVFLAQVLMLLGEWERAANQLTVAAELDSAALPMKHAYGAAMQCERLRAEVFAGRRSPLVFGEPLPWIAGLLQALTLDAEGQSAQACAARAAALEAAQPTAGTINGVPCEWVADADSRLGPILELMMNGAYYWVPFERIACLKIEPPADARDLAWVPAELTWTNGGQAFGLVPVRYPGSEASADPAIRMSRKTEWRELGPDEYAQYAGLGQRMLTSDAQELGLLEVREIRLGATGA